LHIVIDPYRREEPVWIPLEHREAGLRYQGVTIPANKVVFDDAARPIVGYATALELDTATRTETV
jgi:hypothetical protein